jgi:hypothetical protein
VRSQQSRNRVLFLRISGNRVVDLPLLSKFQLLSETLDFVITGLGPVCELVTCE